MGEASLDLSALPSISELDRYGVLGAPFEDNGLLVGSPNQDKPKPKPLELLLVMQYGGKGAGGQPADDLIAGCADADKAEMEKQGQETATETVTEGRTIEGALVEARVKANRDFHSIHIYGHGAQGAVDPPGEGPIGGGEVSEKDMDPVCSLLGTLQGVMEESGNVTWNVCESAFKKAGTNIVALTAALGELGSNGFPGDVEFTGSKDKATGKTEYNPPKPDEQGTSQSTPASAPKEVEATLTAADLERYRKQVREKAKKTRKDVKEKQAGTKKK